MSAYPNHWFILVGFDNEGNMFSQVIKLDNLEGALEYHTTKAYPLKEWYVIDRIDSKVKLTDLTYKPTPASKDGEPESFNTMDNTQRFSIPVLSGDRIVRVDNYPKPE